MTETRQSRFFYGWVVAGLCFVILFVYGTFFSYGVFFKPLAQEFGWSRSATALTFSIFMVTYTVCAIPLGWLYDRFGPRLPLWLAATNGGIGLILSSRVNSLWQLYVSFGLVGGSAFGAILLVTMSTSVKWFVARRGLVVGMVVAGVGAGLTVLPLLFGRLVIAYGWRPSFIIAGIGYFLVITIATFFMKGSPEAAGHRAYGAERLTSSPSTLPAAPVALRDMRLGQALRTAAFWMLYFSFAFGFAAEIQMAIHLVPYATDKGMSLAMAAGALSLLGVGNTGGRIIWGAVSDRIGRLRTLMLCYLLEAAALLLMPAVTGYLSIYLLALLLGLAYGGWAALFSPIIAEYFGVTHLGKILSVAMTCGAVAGVLGPALSGYIYDVTTSYRLAFLLYGVLCLVAALLVFLARSLVPKQTAAPQPQAARPK